MVDGESVASETYSDVTSATITAIGTLGDIASQYVPITVKFTWRISLTTIAFHVSRWYWNVVVRCTVHGVCKCAVDSNALDNGSFSYGQDTWVNVTSVKWDAGAGGNDTYLTSYAGVYTFYNVPCGYNITLTLNSEDTHHHGTGTPPPVETKSYYESRNLGQVGTTVWFFGRWNWSTTTSQENFNLNPL